MKTFLKILFIALIFSCALDAHADGATDVMCNAIRYIHGIGGPMITVVVIGPSLLAIFGKMPWPALFSLGMFVAVFFGAPQIVKAVTEKEVCCLFEGQMMKGGKCVATPEYDFVGQRCRNFNGRRICCSRADEVLTNKNGDLCTQSTNPSDWWQKYK